MGWPDRTIEALKLIDRLEIVARLLFAAICVTTAMWGVFAFIPFTYTQIIQFELFDPLTWFGAHHPLFAWGAAALAAFILRTRIVRGERAAIGVIVVMVAASIALTLHPVINQLRNEEASLWIGLSALTPILLLSISDWTSCAGRLAWRRTGAASNQAGRLLIAGTAAAAFVWLLYAAIAVWRGGASVAETEALWASVATLVLFAGFIAALSGWESAGGGCTYREFFIGLLIVTCAIAVLLDRLVLNAIAFSGAFAAIAATAIAFAFALTWGSIALTMRANGVARADEIRSGIELWLAPSGRPTPWRTVALRCVILAVFGWVATRQAGIMDWNFLAQKLVAIVVWTLALATMFAAVRELELRPRALVFMAACVAPIGFGGMQYWGDRSGPDHIADLDPSFRVLRDALMPTGATSDLYEYLQANTNIPLNTHVTPVDLNLVRSFPPSHDPPPHVFFIVVDSMRRDYLSTFNPKVTFTPGIDAFAREAIPFTNAYTRYGATGLSEPAIWAGSMLVHKQYVTPFAPMDTLEKLLAAEHYREFVGVDAILSQLLEPTPRRVELDHGIANRDYDLCRSLDELADKAVRAEPGGQPMFAYTQAQNLHISTISRQGNAPIDDDSYGAFEPAYASRLHRLDACFGQFITRLKTSGLYENSIVVLMSDHGDSLGEEGRRGHAYTVFPEVIRIPLIVHLPDGLRSRFDIDPKALTFSTDVTPTLYTLLGHAPTQTAFPLGRSFAHAHGDTPPRRPDDELVVSSYGAVYGVLRNNARRLYIVDAINYQDYEYDLTKGLIGARMAVTPAERESGQAALRRQVEAIARTFAFDAAN